MASEPISVLFDAHQLGRRQTGNETYVRALLATYAGRVDLDLTVLVEQGGAANAVAAPFRRLRVPRPGTLRLAAMTLAARRERPDVLHAIYFAPWVTGRPIVLTVHDISHELFPEFFSRMERLRGQLLVRESARRAALVITASEASRRDLIERYGLSDDRVIAIHYGVDQRFLEAPPREIGDIGDRPVRILALGTLQPRKNLGRLLDAVSQAANSRPIDLRVVGPGGHQADLIQQRLGSVAGVKVVGYVGDESLVGEYQRADMLVYPSIYEGFGLPVVEAMACGTPVITSTGGSLPEVAGDAALLVDPLDASALARTILRLADDRGLRRDLSAKGMVRARGFSWEVTAERHIRVYRDAIGG